MLKINAAEHSVTGMQHDVEQLLQWLQSQNYFFHTISPSSHTAYLTRSGHMQARQLRDIFGWSLPFEADLLPPAIFELLQTHALIEQVADQKISQDPTLWRSRIRISSLNQCLLVHSAYPTTQDNAVFFGPDTYRFVHALTQYLNAKQPHIQRAIEICSGAAPAAITIACYAPHAEVIAADINALALQYSAINA